mgnify:CR=1 FL=1
MNTSPRFSFGGTRPLSAAQASASLMVMPRLPWPLLRVLGNCSLRCSTSRIPALVPPAALALPCAAPTRKRATSSIGFWVADPENGQGNVRGDVNLAILRTLNAAGIEIPFPQRVLRQA